MLDNFMYFLFVINFVLALSSVNYTENTEFTEYELEEIKDNKFALQYLKRFGYLSELLPFQQSEDIMLENGLIKMQKFFGLKETGVFDEATKALMSKPRCGHPDINPLAMNQEGGYGPFHIWRKFNLSYAFHSFTKDMDLHVLRYATRKAFDLWTEVSPFDFYEVETGSAADLRIGFYKHDHDGCTYPFINGRGGMAHAPSMHPNTSENYANIHFDDGFSWVYLKVDVLEDDPKGKVYVDYLETLAHEIGHSLGLLHISHDENSIMYPTYNLKVDSKGKYVYPRLNPSDIEAIRKIYGSRRKFQMPEVYPPSEKTCESSSQDIKQKPFLNYTKEELFSSIHADFNVTYGEVKNATFWLKESFNLYNDTENICKHVTDKLEDEYGQEWACIFTHGNNFSDYINFEKRMVFDLSASQFLVYKLRTVRLEKLFNEYAEDELIKSIVYQQDISEEENTYIVDILTLAFKLNGTIDETLKYITDKLDVKFGREWGCALIKSGGGHYSTMEKFMRFVFGSYQLYVFKTYTPPAPRKPLNTYSLSDTRTSVNFNTFNETAVTNDTIIWLWNAMQDFNEDLGSVCKFVTDRLEKNYFGTWGCVIAEDHNYTYLPYKNILQFYFNGLYIKIFKFRENIV